MVQKNKKTNKISPRGKDQEKKKEDHQKLKEQQFKNKARIMIKK